VRTLAGGAKEEKTLVRLENLSVCLSVCLCKIGSMRYLGFIFKSASNPETWQAI